MTGILALLNLSGQKPWVFESSTARVEGLVEMRREALFDDDIHAHRLDITVLRLSKHTKHKACSH